eukprot:CAMPEP_0177261848 /NCGR_PEP_ID=MMETSP0367-20130122/60050_1 /TAXON_ID=447022 ORGANISM="Scrippsiella hangoei-like, Strain SHHI-4" /NCGR_SAMPLE_ID=MMETSP0367 /ASSEMBLY_ACC=CAM_ASM_000362 /LENGTH=72 /DNA_ID=CAMNT_0018716539 /DNA_START=268 /DNA_END=483 /DNA_ORIENTATION=-
MPIELNRFIQTLIHGSMREPKPTTANTGRPEEALAMPLPYPDLGLTHYGSPEDISPSSSSDEDSSMGAFDCR